MDRTCLPNRLKSDLKNRWNTRRVVSFAARFCHVCDPSFRSIRHCHVTANASLPRHVGTVTLCWQCGAMFVL